MDIGYGVERATRMVVPPSPHGRSRKEKHQGTTKIIYCRMKRAKINGMPTLGTGHQQEILFERPAEVGSDEGKGQDEFSRMRMLENLKLALFFCRVQGRMARGEQ